MGAHAGSRRDLGGEQAVRLIQLACHGDDASHRALVPLLPGLITLDWGFPVITADVPAGLHGEAVTAVGLCPAAPAQPVSALRVTNE